MDGVKALVVLASIYYPGDGIVAKNNYQTSSGERYDRGASKCAALQWPLGTMLHLVRGRNNVDVTINDHGPYRKGRALDCTPAVDKALHLGGLGSVRVEPYPPLPKARPVEDQAATWSGTDPMDATVKPPAELKVWVDLHLKAGSEHKKVVRLEARRPLMQHNPQPIQPSWQVTLP
jgi:rare lipoprotein A